MRLVRQKPSILIPEIAVYLANEARRLRLVTDHAIALIIIDHWPLSAETIALRVKGVLWKTQGLWLREC
jgi:hypothetical protein